MAFKNLLHSFLYPSIFLFGMSSVQASSSQKSEKTPQEEASETLPLRMRRLEALVPMNAPNRLAMSEKLLNLQESLPGNTSKGNGYTFSAIREWHISSLETILTNNKNRSIEDPIFVADWGCGLGTFALHAIFRGMNVWGLDHNETSAAYANKLIWGSKKLLSNPKALADQYKIFVGCVTKPSEKFLSRQNDVSVSFNLIPHLSPDQSDALLRNMAQTTKPGCLVLIVSDTPHGLNLPEPAVSFYENQRKKGSKYPGYALYTRAFQVDRSRILKDVSAVTPKILATQQSESELEAMNLKNIYNFVDYQELSARVQDVGLTVENVFYTNVSGQNPLVPCAEAEHRNLLARHKGKVFLIARKLTDGSNTSSLTGSGSANRESATSSDSSSTSN
ncbi:class I SAM-dependent methyltransferase [Candidatus Finniella inopinata]|uniref:Class I SAM-dependent methyltransferase n=1 Tax=Candidatus Finniella inopinata TaxID=1696036 RepID=A0A4Q7DKT0_9PROT|nr:class I SAM-dependent methyltransferase [Candidatus Finniella inopinata]RZI46939.1 class I SAM-dependent methyltransferase [Candidatus Finniella inopinata]